MKLSKLIFEYRIKDKKFPFISYEFNIFSGTESKEKVIELAKSSLQDLEHILDDNYTVEEFKKEEDGAVTSSRIEFGYDYSNSSSIDMFKKGASLTQLRYVISMNYKGEPKDLTLSLKNIDYDSERALRLFDSVTKIPNLEISDEAQLQINRINSLRSEGFDVNGYLSLPLRD